MKRNFTTLLSTALVAGLTLPLLAQDEPDQPVAAPVPAPIEEPAQNAQESNAPGQNVQELLEAVMDAGSEPALEGAMPIIEGGGERPAGESFIREGGTTARFVRPNRSATNRTAAVTAENFSLNSATPTTPLDKVVKDGERAIRLNFRSAPLDMVLNYLSDVAGFIIVPETDVRGKVDVWSNQPLTPEESVALLNRVLGKEGYAVIRDGRTLTIMTQAAAKKSDIPVRKGSDPAGIQKDQQIVTQIIPVRFLGAVQLAKDLQPLMPTQMSMTANEAGNALLITDTQANIRRLAEIIYALDTSVSSMSAVRVFALRYADAKTVADMVKEVFGNTGNSGGGGGGGRRGGGGGGGGFSFGGLAGIGGLGGAAGGEGGGSSGRPGASKVVAASDERSNSLVVSAPDDLMPTIEQLITAVDMNVDDLTEIRAFRLINADPQETATLLTSLFPDPTAQGQRGGGFGGGFARGGFAGTAAASGDSNRMKKQSKVVAVPDNRTRSIVVTAARDTMQQIDGLIKQLDNDSARKQQVYVIDVQNTDPETVQQALDRLFSGNRNSASQNRNTANQAGGQLNNRARQASQNGGTTRNSGFGGGGGGGGVGGGGNFGGN